MRLIKKMLRYVSKHLPVRTIVGSDGITYLEKYLVWQSSEGRDSWRVHIHRFARSDEDSALHNHPWRTAISLVLTGGYLEDRRVTVVAPDGRPSALDAVVRRTVRPGAINRIYNNTFHRVDLLEDECWTLFLSGPVVSSWGFWSRVTGQFTPWREFIAARGQQPEDGEYWRAQRPS